MKIKGIAGKGHTSLQQGDVIELSPEEKVCSVAISKLVEQSDVANNLKNLPVEVEIIPGTTQKTTDRSDLDNKLHQYQGSAIVTYRVMDLKRDKLFAKKKAKVFVHFKDSKDDLGLPDFEMLDSRVEEV